LQAPRAPTAYAYDIKAHIGQLLANYSTTTREIAHAIIEAESNYKNVEGVTGDMGFFQFSPTTWDWACEGDPFNIEDNIKCGIKLIEEKRLTHWSASRNDRENYQGWYSRLSTTTKNYIIELNTLCNCMQYLRNRGIDFNKGAKEIPVNSRPFIGSVAKFFYTKSWSYHGALVVGFTEKGFLVDDTNYKSCKKTLGREILWSNKSLLGFSNI